MKKRRLLAICLLSSALLWAFTTARAQDDMIVSNLSELVAEAYSGGHCFCFPFISLPWRAYSLDGGQPWWVDCTQIDCTNLLVSPTNLDSGVTAYGVVLTRDLSTGETMLQPDGSTDVVAIVAAPTGFEPGVLPGDASAWGYYQQLLACPDCYGFEGVVPPPLVTLDVFLADVNDYAIYAAYESNLEAQVQAEAATTASVMSLGGSFMAMDDDDGGGGDPCTLTNLLQQFSVTQITAATNHAISISFQSCQFFRYLIFTASQLTSNTVWFPQAYVWGTPGHSSTTWTDTSTTNNDGSTVTQRFYRVQRILGTTIAAGGYHSLAILTNGSLWAWGGDDQNQLGDNATLAEFFPIDVTNAIFCSGVTFSNLVTVAAGYDYSLAVDASGVLWSWGDGGQGADNGTISGRLGNGGYTNVSTPTSIDFSNVVSAAGGYTHTLALRADGTVWAWGSDDYGQLGNGGSAYSHSVDSPIPCQFPPGTVIVGIAAGYQHSVAVDASGNVWTWGYNGQGQLGNGHYGDFTTSPTMLTTISNAVAVAAGSQHSIALTADKTVWTWGDNTAGELGRSNACSYYCYLPVPGQVFGNGLSGNVVAIAAGAAFSAAVTSNGQVYAWGDNTFGELGTINNAVSSTNRPMLVAGISNAVSLSASSTGLHSVALTTDPGTNHIWAWGLNNQGQVGTTTGNLPNPQPYAPTPDELQFCDTDIQLGTGGVFTAHCTGILYLYFNDQQTLFGDNSGAYTATVGVVSNVIVPGYFIGGVATGTVAGTVSNGFTYSYTASGLCINCSSGGCAEDANGVNTETGQLEPCSDRCSFICPNLQCYSLVGKIEPQ